MKYAVSIIRSPEVLSTMVKTNNRKEMFIVVYGSADGDRASIILITFAEQKNHKPLGDAKEITLKDAESIKAEQEFQSSPIVEFNFVTVTP
jgi:hypothetical protein